jgi:membrane-bound ClpP family serine protease
MTLKTYELWIERGQANENIWMLCILPLLMPYVYYRLGNEKKGIVLIILGILLTLISYQLIRIYSVGIAFFAFSIFDTYLIARRFNEHYQVTNRMELDLSLIEIL